MSLMDPKPALPQKNLETAPTLAILRQVSIRAAVEPGVQCASYKLPARSSG